MSIIRRFEKYVLNIEFYQKNFEYFHFLKLLHVFNLIRIDEASQKNIIRYIYFSDSVDFPRSTLEILNGGMQCCRVWNVGCKRYATKLRQVQSIPNSVLTSFAPLQREHYSPHCRTTHLESRFVELLPIERSIYRRGSKLHVLYTFRKREVRETRVNAMIVCEREREREKILKDSSRCVGRRPPRRFDS